jgi:hypothetical protein
MTAISASPDAGDSNPGLVASVSLSGAARPSLIVCKKAAEEALNSVAIANAFVVFVAFMIRSLFCLFSSDFTNVIG